MLRLAFCLLLLAVTAASAQRIRVTTAPPTQPPPANIPSAMNSINDTSRVTWSSVTGAVSYTIDYQEFDDYNVIIQESGISVTNPEFIIPSFNVSRSYHIGIIAVGSNGLTSAEPCLVHISARPTNVSAAMDEALQGTLYTWDSPRGSAVTTQIGHYILHVTVGAATEPTQHLAMSNSYLLDQGTPGTTIKVKVYATSAKGGLFSGGSDEHTYTVPV